MQAGSDSVSVTNEETVKILYTVTKHKEFQDANRNNRFGGIAAVGSAKLNGSKGSTASIRFVGPQPFEQLFMLAGVADP